MEIKGTIIGKVVLIYCILSTILLNGCGIQKLDTAEKKTIDYTVLSSKDIPEDFAKEIEKTQDVDFKLTYSDNEYLYIAKGYGERKTGGYSISVTNFYSSTNTLYFETEICGPQKGESVNSKKSYPYIVVKIEYTEQPVVFL